MKKEDSLSMKEDLSAILLPLEVKLQKVKRLLIDQKGTMNSLEQIIEYGDEKGGRSDPGLAGMKMELLLKEIAAEKKAVKKSLDGLNDMYRIFFENTLSLKRKSFECEEGDDAGALSEEVEILTLCCVDLKTVLSGFEECYNDLGAIMKMCSRVRSAH